MNSSDSLSKLAPALLAAQKAITYAALSKANPAFKGRKYADLPTVIDAIKPALNDAGITFIQMPAPSDEHSLALTTRLLHESGEWIESTATCPLQKYDPQGYGSAITYLRRYGLAAATGLYQDDDDGNASSDPKEPDSKAIAKVNAINSVAELMAFYKSLTEAQRAPLIATFTARRSVLESA